MGKYTQPLRPAFRLGFLVASCYGEVEPIYDHRFIDNTLSRLELLFNNVELKH